MNRRTATLAAVLAATAGLALAGAAIGQTPIGTEFTYQGELRLTTPAGPATGAADFRFRLYAASSGGAPVGSGEITKNAVTLASGRFTVSLDFGSSGFGPDARWLEIDVRNPAGSGAFVTLTPRQRITVAPVARYASEAGTAAGAANATLFSGQNSAFYTNAGNMNSGTLPGARLSGAYGNALSLTNAGNSFAGSGAGLTGLNASGLASGTLDDARLSANVALRNAANAFTASGNTFSGFVGIGRNSPVSGADVLAVRSPTLGSFGGMYVDTAGAGAWPFYGYATDGSARAWHYYNGGTGSWHLDNNGTRLSITNTGHVGIGTELPASTLDISSQAIGPNISHAHHGTNGDWYIRSASSSGSVVLQDTGGSVGVGTSTPVTRLHVHSTSSDVLRLTGPGQFQFDARLRFQDNTGNVYLHNDIDGGLVINTNESFNGRLALMGSNVGIGTLTPATTLDIVDSGQAQCRLITGTAVNGAVLELRNNSALPVFLGAINFSDSGGGVPGQIGYSPGANDAMTFRVGGATRMTVFESGLTQVKTLQILGGSDLAEPFDVSAAGEMPPEPGHVVVIDPANPGDLVLCSDAYDGKVAGIISGANGLAAGLVLKSEGDPMADGAHAVAMTGRVWCWADASFGAIGPGDRLTTSVTPGHAMVVGDATRADGAVIGKAMTELREGRGLVLVLVNLQ